jgi:hypothetical protein
MSVVSSVPSVENNNYTDNGPLGSIKSDWDKYRNKNLSMEKIKKTTGSLKPWQKFSIITFLLIVLSIILVLTISDPAKYRSFSGFILGIFIYCFIFICFYYLSNFIIKSLYKS